VHSGFVNALEMLPMPRVRGLTSAQITGRACPWCRQAFDADAGIALGTRIRPVGVRLEQWFPRACAPCIRRQAGRVARLHTETCMRCTRHAYCADGRALHQLARAPE
jgi:hypothetical protein